MAGNPLIYLYLLMFWFGYELNITLIFADCPFIVPMTLFQKQCNK